MIRTFWAGSRSASATWAFTRNGAWVPAHTVMPPPQGQRSVSPMNMSTCSRGTSSSSAASMAREVMLPWPISTLPTKQPTRPSAPMRR